MTEEVIAANANTEANAKQATVDTANEKGVFQWELCDSSYNSMRGLRAHKGRAHKHKENTGSHIAQLDGQSERLEDNQDTGSTDDEAIKSSDAEEHSCYVCDFAC